MPDRYSFSSPFGRGFGGGREWFRLGNLDVTTTTFIIGVGLIWFLVWAIEGPEHALSEQLILVSQDAPGVGSVLDGQFWRLVTWPIVNEPDIWAIILFAVFYMLGNQLEGLMGRRPFLWFLAMLTVLPAVAVTILELILPGFDGIVFGLRFVQLGVLVAFAAQYPTARFWPGIPAWGIAGAIVALDLIQAVSDRNRYHAVMLATTVVVGLIGLRSFGHANEVPWIPRVRLPSAMTGEAPSRPSSPSGRPRRKGRRSRANLSAVPTPQANDPLADMEIDALLDQVAEHGLDSLSKSQRKRLEEHSKRLRKRRGE